MKHLTALILALALALTATAALAQTWEPVETAPQSLAGATVSATIGAFNEETETFLVTLYENDCFTQQQVEELAVGDTLVAGGRLYKVTEKGTLDESILICCDNGEEIYFYATDDENLLTARSTDDDRIFMHAFRVMHLPAAADIALEDWSDPEMEEPAVTHGLENVLKVKAEKEAFSIGLYYYATTITLNENLEIANVHVAYDVAQ